MPPDPVLFVLAWAPLAVLRLLGADRCARWLNDRASRRTLGEQGGAASAAETPLDDEGESA